jgi:D-alanyl-D-alanine carboxypeptidase (penicillin-binding protein 5/6)
MKNSHFANPDGFPDSNHYTTAGDMIIIAVKAYSFSLIRNVVNQPWATAYFESGGSASYTNSNETINPYSDRYYPYMVGIKTGSHSLAGQCLVTVAKKKNEKTGKTRTFVAVVYNCPSKYGRYMDLKGLYDTAFAKFGK